MKVLLRSLIIFILFAAWRGSAAPPPGYYEVWGDEFSGTALDPTKWWVWNQPDQSGYTTPDAVTEAGGYLTIHCYSTNGQNYSGIISSDGNFRPRYGYLESSVEFNGSPGMFSDFWINSANNGNILGDVAAEGAEVDVCEHRATDANDADDISGQVTVDIHWNGYTSGVEQSINGPLVGSGLGTGFHTYGLLWTSNNYNVTIDGTTMLNTNFGVSQRTEIVLMSCEIHSNSFCGIVPTGGYGNFLVSTTSTVFDYVRFYAPTTTLYWIGTSSANWSDTNNWLSNMTPTAATDAVFSYLSKGNFNVNLGGNTTVNSLSIQEAGPVSINNGPLTVNGGIDLLSSLYNVSVNTPINVTAAQQWNAAPGVALVVNGNVSGPGSLVINGPGVIALEQTNNFTGPTTISNGVLQIDGVLTNTVTVAGGTLDGGGTVVGNVAINSGIVSGPQIINGPLTVKNGTLTGTETVLGPVTINSGGTLSPGSPLGAMTIDNSLTLQPGSSTVIYLNPATGTGSQIVGLSSITCAGTLIVSNQSGAFGGGQSYPIFMAASYSGAFTRITPPTPGPGLAWDTTSLASQGILRVISTNTTTITAQLSGNQVSLAWPADHAGWLLQTQTNLPGAGLTTNWVTVPGSNLTNLLNLAINPAVGSVFYRLATPAYSTAVFGAGDLLVLQVGNGSINADGAPGYLNDYLPTGGALQVQVPLPTTGSSALIFGASSYDGVLSLSPNGQNVVVEGYNVPTGSYGSAIDSSSTSSVIRAIGLVAANGTFSIAATTKQFSGSTIRSAITDGAGNYWAGGGASGVVYLGSNSPAATVSTVATSTREVGLFNGNIYFTEATSGIGVMGFSGSPTSAAAPTMKINTQNTGSGTASPKGFVFNPGMTIAYVADNRAASSGGGIQRFNWNGSSWVYAYTLADNLTSSAEVDDVIANFSGTNPVIYAITGETTGNHIITTTDTGAGAGANFKSVEYAPSGDAFRGIVFAP